MQPISSTIPVPQPASGTDFSATAIGATANEAEQKKESREEIYRYAKTVLVTRNFSPSCLFKLKATFSISSGFRDATEGPREFPQWSNMLHLNRFTHPEERESSTNHEP